MSIIPLSLFTKAIDEIAGQDRKLTAYVYQRSVAKAKDLQTETKQETIQQHKINLNSAKELLSTASNRSLNSVTSSVAEKHYDVNDFYPNGVPENIATEWLDDHDNVDAKAFKDMLNYMEIPGGSELETKMKSSQFRRKQALELIMSGDHLPVRKEYPAGTVLLKITTSDSRSPHSIYLDSECISLVFDQKYTVNFDVNRSETNLVIFSPMINIDEKGLNNTDLLSAYKRLLTANLFWEKTGGATIGMTEENQVILAFKVQIDSLNSEILVSLVSGFVDHLEILIDTLEAPDQQSNVSHSENTDFMIKI